MGENMDKIGKNVWKNVLEECTRFKNLGNCIKSYQTEYWPSNLNSMCICKKALE